MGLGELRLGLSGDSGDLVAGSAGTGSSSEGVGTGPGGDAAFWGAAGAARAAGLAQSMEEAGLGSRELSLGPPILPAPGVARSAQLIALPGEFVF